MKISYLILLLFLLNIVDAVMTIIWVRNGVATEANGLMAGLLDIGDFPFLLVKLGMGTFMALVLLKGADNRLAKYAVAIGLLAYAGAMSSHILVGLAVIGNIA